MKRLHLHLKTKDLDRSVSFYTALFGAEPTKREADYVQWKLDDPCANVSLSASAEKEGVDHAGVSLESRNDLETVAARLRDEGVALLAEEATTCCYARSDKYWAEDPQGAVWELFHSFADSPTAGAGPDRSRIGAPE